MDARVSVLSASRLYEQWVARWSWLPRMRFATSTHIRDKMVQDDSEANLRNDSRQIPHSGGAGLQIFCAAWCHSTGGGKGGERVLTGLMDETSCRPG